MSPVVGYEMRGAALLSARGLSGVSARSQRGVVLFIALIVLVAMTLAGIALVRSVDTANVIAGNLAFKQGMVPEADNAVEAAINALTGPPPGVKAISNPLVDDPAQNYWASKQDDDLRGVPLVLVAAGAGWPFEAYSSTTKNTVRYLIDRLCTLNTGTPDEIRCSLVSEDEKGGSQPADKTGAEKVPVYRITVRVDGPHNTRTYTQTFASITQ